VADPAHSRAHIARSSASLARYGTSRESRARHECSQVHRQRDAVARTGDTYGARCTVPSQELLALFLRDHQRDAGWTSSPRAHAKRRLASRWSLCGVGTKLPRSTRSRTPSKTVAPRRACQLLRGPDVSSKSTLAKDAGRGGARATSKMGRERTAAGEGADGRAGTHRAAHTTPSPGGCTACNLTGQ
jgi:hypothetical protein